MRHYPIALAIGGLTLLAACDVDQTREAEAPDVDVNASGGQMPAYDVDTPEVNVGTTERQVDVPDVDVQTEQQTVEVPTVTTTE